jgi:hypothetical protein
MDNLVVPFVDVMLGSFVFVVGLLFVLGLVDEFKERRSPDLFVGAEGFSAGQETKLLPLVKARRRRVQAQNTEHAKAA